MDSMNWRMRWNVVPTLLLNSESRCLGILSFIEPIVLRLAYDFHMGQQMMAPDRAAKAKRSIKSLLLIAY